MPTNVKRHITFILGLFLVVSSFGQSREELIRLGDHAYDQANYASAAMFYNKIITGQSAGLEETIYPYQFKHSNRSFKKDAADTLNNDADSTRMDSTVSVAVADISHDSLGAHLNIAEEDVEISYIRHRLAECYRLDYNYFKAEAAYKLATEHPHALFHSSLYWYGTMMMANEKYEDAKPIFLDFITNSAEDPELRNLRKLAKKKLQSCSYALKYDKPDPSIKFTDADSTINIGKSSLGVSFFGEDHKITYASARPTSTRDKHQSDDRIMTFDIFVAEQDGDHWSPGKHLRGPINTGANEGNAIMNMAATKLYFTRCDEEGCAIYVSNYFNNQWMKPMKLNEKVNLPGYSAMHPALSHDEKAIYFSSNKPGGKGGYDLWVADIDQWGKADSALNLGSKINTKGDEKAPFLHHESNVFYYSSNGHKGYGGFDIFESSRVVQGIDVKWSYPKNMKKPYNSSKDDVFFSLSTDEKFGFITSDRRDCEDCPTGNCLEIYTFKAGPVQFEVEGLVENADTYDPIKGARVTIRDVHTDTIIAIAKTDETGFYSAKLAPNMTYYIKAQKRRFFSQAASVETIKLKKSEIFVRDFALTSIPLSEIDIPGIEYDYDSANLRDKSKELLLELVDFLALNDQLVIEIRSHTDVRGSDSYNLNLSDRRAKSVVTFLIENNINKNRLVHKGFGETTPIVKDAQTEEQHQLNRRTTFKVISEDFIE